jgi:hypothetical protein
MLSEFMRVIPLYEANIKQLISFMNSQCDIGESVETLSEARTFWDISPSIPDSEIGTYLNEWCERNRMNPTYFILDTYVEDHRPKERREEEQGKEYQTVTLPGLGTCRIYTSLDRIVYLWYQYEYYSGSTLLYECTIDELKDESPSNEPMCTLYWLRIKVWDISLSEYKALVNSIGKLKD